MDPVGQYIRDTWQQKEKPKWEKVKNKLRFIQIANTSLNKKINKIKINKIKNKIGFKIENTKNSKIKTDLKLLSSNHSNLTKSVSKSKLNSKFFPLDWMQYFFMFVMHPFFKLACPRLVLDMNMNQAVVLGQVGQYYKTAMYEEMQKCGINTSVFE